MWRAPSAASMSSCGGAGMVTIHSYKYHTELRRRKTWSHAHREVKLSDIGSFFAFSCRRPHTLGGENDVMSRVRRKHNGI